MKEILDRRVPMSSVKGNNSAAMPASERIAPETFLSKLDLIVAAVFFLVAFAAYGTLAHRLAQGRYFEYLNLAFDFDPYLVFSLLTDRNGESLGFKHPLMLTLRPLGLGLMALGLSAKSTAATIMSAFGAGTVVLMWCFLRLAKIHRLEACLLSLLFGLSSTQILNSIIPESYGISEFGIALLWCISLIRINSLSRNAIFWRYFAALIVVGATITNVVQVFIAEMSVWYSKFDLRATIRKTSHFAIVLGSLFAIACVLVWHTEIWEAIKDPIKAGQKIWWLQTKGPRSDLIEVVRSLLAFSFVAPDYTHIKLPETTDMRDFRSWSFVGFGEITMVLWIMFAFIGTACSLAKRKFRTLAIGLTLSVLFNVLFHLNFQFRGSIFLYAAHAHFVAFALSAGGALLVREKRAVRSVYIAVLVLMVTLFAANNLRMAREFVSGFDTPDTSCPAPCR